jgi:hypothetical protein
MKNLLLIFVAVATVLPRLAHADTPIVPGDGFTSARYEDLWKKSPFAVATPEAAPDSPDYALVGIAQSEGLNYASVIDRKNQEHYLLSSDKPNNGLTLTSLTPGQNGSDTIAVVTKDGQAMTLKLEQVASPAPGMPMTSTIPQPGMNPPPIQPPMPNATAGISIPMPGSNQEQFRPNLPRFRRPLIHLPPPPGGGGNPPLVPGAQPPAGQTAYPSVPPK